MLKDKPADLNTDMELNIELGSSVKGLMNSKLARSFNECVDANFRQSGFPDSVNKGKYLLEKM